MINNTNIINLSNLDLNQPISPKSLTGKLISNQNPQKILSKEKDKSPNKMKLNSNKKIKNVSNNQKTNENQLNTYVTTNSNYNDQCEKIIEDIKNKENHLKQITSDNKYQNENQKKKSFFSNQYLIKEENLNEKNSSFSSFGDFPFLEENKNSKIIEESKNVRLSTKPKEKISFKNENLEKINTKNKQNLNKNLENIKNPFQNSILKRKSFGTTSNISLKKNLESKEIKKYTKSKSFDIKKNSDKIPCKQISKISRCSSVKKDLKKSEEERNFEKNNQKNITKILKKSRVDRGKSELKNLSRFLANDFEFFKQISQENNGTLKLEAIAISMELASFEENENIFHCGEVGNSFYIIINGSVDVIIPKFYEKEMTLPIFVKYLNEIKFIEKNLMKLDRIQQANSKLINLNNIILFNYDEKRFTNHTLPKKFLVEKDQILLSINEGEIFGHYAIRNNLKRTATIRTKTKCKLAVLERNEFNKAYYEIEEKLYTQKIIEFKSTYYVFKDLRRNQVFNMLNYCDKINVSCGDILYKQNEIPDYFYISLEGKFELITCVSLSSYKDFLQYINNQKNSLINKMYKEGYINNTNYEDELKKSGINKHLY